jgi:hypothetical protein
MKFKCLTCEKTISKDYDVDPIHGDALWHPWYRDDSGLNHSALVCLHCGTIHDVSGSFLHGLFSLFQCPLKVHNDINPLELAIAVTEYTQHPKTESRHIAINSFGIPEKVVDVLVKRELLGNAFAK